MTHNIKDNAKKFDSILPKELPLEKDIYITTQRELFERVKDTIQVTIAKIRK